ncbi:MAG: hypothetical protein AMDU1_APLC00020G0092 [Thermoplasmatales archaeon A-plasma]|jgi:hypothetical protein|nr:MAG: hypothetical protein AMDU1_APLC00020G0092 [Thermoplasmatales archaeon A-plasma]WMT44035.1 MAG: hypothetical protein RE469_07455 [Cuniculiplasma divulgatum]
MAARKKNDNETEEEADLSETIIKLEKEDISAINLLRQQGESALQVIRRALQDSLEYGVMKDMLSSIDGRITELSNKYKTSQSTIINFKYDVDDGLRVPEELRKGEDRNQKVTNLKQALEKKWSELEEKKEKNKQ